MKEAIIKEIVELVFQKAKAECPKHSKYALSNHISESTSLSSKTLERLYDKYLKNKDVVGEQYGNTINDLCNYIGFKSYADYVEQNGKRRTEANNIDGKKTWNVFALVSIIIVIGLIVGLSDRNKEIECMVWKVDHFEKIDCNTSYTDNIVPLDEVRFNNFRKKEVSMITDFFDEITNKPIIWYYRSGKKIEYFTAPGLHPVNGNTLKPITEYMINKSVPVHTYDENSFTK